MLLDLVVHRALVSTSSILILNLRILIPIRRRIMISKQ